MKKLTLIAAITVTFAATLTACSKPNDNEPIHNNAQSSPAKMEQNNVDASVTRADSAETSLDWAGDYEGVFPCADCEGIKVELDLNPDKTYELKEEYLGSKGGNNETETKGSFSFDPQDPSIITLDNNADNRKFFVGENFIEARDVETGKKIDSNLNYKLVKKSAS
ncbi:MULTISPECIES: copper resistance protein NlpE [unclassified Acinetobacter]|uniref:copper resistance protein NlpE n=1 Tax=unclassified Acinetobacter TaxID=196816 RepID=UPI001C249B27|nr:MULTISPECIES: copper resistance protein NlpE [unclassified Acinetobacter]